MEDIRILKSKMVRPRSTNTIQRSRLMPLWDEARNKRLITVVAGAGYGKTTLVNRASRVTDVDTIWYKLDQGDSDLITFIRYLVAGIATYYSGFGGETLKRLRLIKSLRQDQGEILNIFLSEIESTIQNHMIIILDDYHMVDHSGDINTAVEFMIEHFSEWIHFTIVSRKKPGIRMSRLRASRELLEITENELAFSRFEIKNLFSEAFEIELTEMSIDLLKEKTGGWVTGLILFYHYFKKNSNADIQKLLSEFSGAHKDITTYIDENVYDLLPEDIQTFLLKSSVLSRFTTDLCNAFFRTTDAERILRRLAEDHLFIQSFFDTTQWFSYHQIFQDYLLNRLQKTLSEDEIRQVHSDAATCWIQMDEPEEALDHLLLSGDFEKACVFFDTVGRRLRYEGKIRKLHSLIRKIPEKYLQDHPWILYNSGNIYDLLGNQRQAVASYEKALAAFTEAKNDKGAGLCLNRLINNYCIAGDFEKAEMSIRGVIERFRDNLPIYITASGFLICILAVNRKMDEAERCFREALNFPDQPGNEIYRVWLYCTNAFYLCAKGHFEEALGFMEKARSIVKAFENHPVVFSVEHIMSWINYSLGNFESGLLEAENAIKTAKKEGYKDFNFAWLNIYACLNAAELGLYKEAVALGQTGMEGFKRCDSVWAQGLAAYALSIAEQTSGDRNRAVSYAEDAIRFVKQSDAGVFLGAIKSNLARILSDRKDTADPERLFLEAEKELEGFQFYKFRHHIWKARFYHSGDYQADCEASLATALRISEGKRYICWFGEETGWIIEPLVSLYTQKRGPEIIDQLIERLGTGFIDPLLLYSRSCKADQRTIVSGFIRKIQSSMPKALRINCFGPLQIFRGEMEIREELWTSHNAKTLFKYLSLNHTAGYVPREKLQELLWPDEDPDKTLNRLHVAFNSLRKTLEPELPPRAESSFLLRKGDSYRLSTGHQGSTDIDLFRSSFKKALTSPDPGSAIHDYLTAESLYRGELFSEDPYAEWCMHDKERFRQDYVTIAVTIIEHYFKENDVRNILSHASRLVRIDPYNEQGYLYLMRLYLETGNTGMFFKTYEHCRTAIEDDLGLTLCADIQEMFIKMSGTKKSD